MHLERLNVLWRKMINKKILLAFVFLFLVSGVLAQNLNFDDLEWDIDKPVLHEASEIKVYVDGEYYSLQEVFDHRLVNFPINAPNSILLRFDLESGETADVDPFCSREDGWRFGNEKYVKYNKEVGTNPYIFSGGIYDFSCTIGDVGEVFTYRVQLNDNYTTFITTQKLNNPVQRAGGILNLIKGNTDKEQNVYDYQVALIDNELNFRITRPTACRNRILTSVTIPTNCGRNLVCAYASSIPGCSGSGFSKTSDGFGEIEYELLQTNTGGGTCGDGTCSGAEWAYNNCIPDCGGTAESIDAGSSLFEQITEGILCDRETVNLPSRVCENNQCPIYEVRGNILDRFKKEEIKEWDGVSCSIKAAY